MYEVSVESFFMKERDEIQFYVIIGDNLLS